MVFYLGIAPVMLTFCKNSAVDIPLEIVLTGCVNTATIENSQTNRERIDHRLCNCPRHSIFKIRTGLEPFAETSTAVRIVRNVIINRASKRPDGLKGIGRIDFIDFVPIRT